MAVNPFATHHSEEFAAKALRLFQGPFIDSLLGKCTGGGGRRMFGVEYLRSKSMPGYVESASSWGSDMLSELSYQY